MTDRNWTIEQQVNAERYGVCFTCGEPRGILKTILPGSKTPYVKMVCTADETHDVSGMP